MHDAGVAGDKMRNALICAGTMLAMLLAWPMLFGGTAASTSAASAAGSTVTMRVPAPVAVRRAAQPAAPPTAPLASLPKLTNVNESCRTSLARVRQLCAPADTACGQSAEDAFDICEARGRWPS